MCGAAVAADSGVTQGLRLGGLAGFRVGLCEIRTGQAEIGLHNGAVHVQLPRSALLHERAGAVGDLPIDVTDGGHGGGLEAIHLGFLFQ